MNRFENIGKRVQFYNEVNNEIVEGKIIEQLNAKKVCVLIDKKCQRMFKKHLVNRVTIDLEKLEII